MVELRYVQDRTQAPFYQDIRQTIERKWNVETAQYESEPGNLYTIERYMPVPYNILLQVDLLTSNTDSKFQLLEQILVLFNPGIELQSTDNPLDWTSVFNIRMSDVRWSSKTIPTGTTDEIDVATLQFEVPVWISPPAKVKRQTIIQRIITDIHSTIDVEGLGYQKNYKDFFDTLEDDAEIIVTPGDYLVEIVGTTASLVNTQGQNINWEELIEQTDENSLLKLNISNDTDSVENLVFGSVANHPTNASVLVFNLDSDTLPSDTLSEVSMIIDPRGNYPGDGNLIDEAIGQRYLLANGVNQEGYPGWNLAKPAAINDIIEYNGTEWIISFDANAMSSVEYVTNTFTSVQYKWQSPNWISSYEGTYRPGYWNLTT